jgi:hypothetical protein
VAQGSRRGKAAGTMLAKGNTADFAKRRDYEKHSAGKCGVFPGVFQSIGEILAASGGAARLPPNRC